MNRVDRSKLEAIIRLLLESGHLTPLGSRQIMLVMGMEKDV